MGAGFVINKSLVVGPNKLTAVGTNPIQGPMDEYENQSETLWKSGAIEVFISGPGLENYYKNQTGSNLNSRKIVEFFQNNDNKQL